MKDQKKLTGRMAIACILWLSANYSIGQGVAINVTGAVPDASAILDVNSTAKGLLIPQMTAAERDAIAAPANSLLIFNTTTICYEGYNLPTTTWVSFGCIGCTVPSSVTASAAPNPICVGSTLTLTGGATNATAWNWTGPNSYTSILQSPTIAGITTAGAGVYTLAASNTCGSVPASTASVTVNAAPTTAAAGTDINPACDVTTATLAGNAVTPPETGLWTIVGTGMITTPTSPTSGVTGLAAAGTATLTWTISNAPCAASTDDVVITTTSCAYVCSGDGTFVDPRDGTTYGYVDISGRRWMCQNLAYLPSVFPVTAQSPAVPYYYVYDYNGTDVAAAKATANYTTYGVLYNWTATANVICPTGWRVSSDVDWCTLENFSEGGTDPGCNLTGNRGTNPGANMKETGTTHWTTHACQPGCATNTSGFTALPGGARYNSDEFYGVGDSGFWWTSVGINSTNAWYHSLSYATGSATRNSLSKAFGMSVRCIKN